MQEELENIGTLSEVCKRLSLERVKDAALDLSESIGQQNLSYEIVSLVAYLAQINPLIYDKIFDAQICVPVKASVGVQIRGFNLFPRRFTFPALASITVFKNPYLSEEDTIVTIIWDAICGGFSEEYFQWLGTSKGEMDYNKFVEIVRNKLKIS